MEGEGPIFYDIWMRVTWGDINTGTIFDDGVVQKIKKMVSPRLILFLTSSKHISNVFLQLISWRRRSQSHVPAAGHEG
jgi:trehalose utilization protein